MRRWWMMAVWCAVIAGCAPERAEILVSTTPPGASCTLARLGRPIATTSPTPAIALVEPASGAITVTCRRAGFGEATKTLTAEPSTWGWMTGASDDDRHRVDIALVPAPR